MKQNKQHRNVELKIFKPIKPKKELTEQDLQNLEIMKNYKNPHPQQYLNVDQQLKKLKLMNFTIDVDEKLAKDYLSKESYAKFFKSYEDGFIDFLPTSNNSYKINIYQNSKPHHLTKYWKSLKFTYLNNKFSELIDLKKSDEELRKFLYQKIINIELVIKSKLSNFIGEELGDKTWVQWLLKVAQKEYVFKILQMGWESQAYKDFIHNVVNKMEFGKLKDLIEIILKSEKITPRKQKKFCKELFIKGLGKYVDLKYPDYDDLINKLVLLNRVRNYVAHGERFGEFLLKERLNQIKYRKYYTEFGEFLIFRIVDNNNENKNLKYWIDNYNSNKIQGLKNLKEKSTNQLLNSFKIGYFIEIENPKTGKFQCLELNILKMFNWWFK